ncbi:hypothetical protein EH183_34115 [Streptomyces sp. CB01881]|nr:hypothetical protein C2142_34050 [Streptomyces sp. CB01881]TYC69260.1 hypothetical protein EH183_34115 [Streptomyces sp. CB01881]
MTSAIEGYRLSTQQRHIWGLLAAGRPESYAAWCAVRVQEPCDPRQLRAALERLAARHEILRTVFRRPAGVEVPLQVISDDRTEVGFETHDLRELPADEQRKRYAELREAWPARPVDLEHGPALSAALVLMTGKPGDTAQLLLRLPAVCADEASLRVLVGELAQDGEPDDEPDDGPLQYADFAQWQNDLLTAEEFGLEREYWLGQDPAGLVGPELPFSGHSAEKALFRPAVLRRQLQAELRTGLRELAWQLGVEPSTVVLAVWRLLLERIATAADFAVGVRFDNRGAEELRSAVGAFVKYLPSSTRSGSDESLAGFARRLQDELDRMGEVQEYFGWEQIESRLPQTRSGALFTAAFDWSAVEPVPRARTFQLDEADAVTERFEVRVAARDDGGSLRLDLWYDTGVLSPVDARLLSGQLLAVLRAAVADPGTSLRALAVVDAAPEDGRPADRVPATGGRGTDAVHVQVAEQARRHPQREAVRVLDRTLSYAELDEGANRLAHHLRSLGADADRPIGLCLDRSVDFVVGLLGIMKAGGAYLPLDPALPAARRSELLGRRPDRGHLGGARRAGCAGPGRGPAGRRPCADRCAQCRGARRPGLRRPARVCDLHVGFYRGAEGGGGVPWQFGGVCGGGWCAVGVAGWFAVCGGVDACGGFGSYGGVPGVVFGGDVACGAVGCGG